MSFCTPHIFFKATSQLYPFCCQSLQQISFLGLRCIASFSSEGEVFFLFFLFFPLGFCVYFREFIVMFRREANWVEVEILVDN